MIKDILNKLEIKNEKYLIVGCSAGPDSMALLHLLKNNTNKIIICAHINHKVRKEYLRKIHIILKKHMEYF